MIRLPACAKKPAFAGFFDDCSWRDWYPTGCQAGKELFKGDEIYGHTLRK
jgi:hypothetical protein